MEVDVGYLGHKLLRFLFHLVVLAEPQFHLLDANVVPLEAMRRREHPLVVEETATAERFAQVSPEHHLPGIGTLGGVHAANDLSVFDVGLAHVGSPSERDAADFLDVHPGHDPEQRRFLHAAVEPLVRGHAGVDGRVLGHGVADVDEAVAQVPVPGTGREGQAVAQPRDAHVG
uniref:Putative secreted protein n=1 Tax=Ixodes ricinus TaxID=34613 RepID=A0A6B0UYD0_IXORI